MSLNQCQNVGGPKWVEPYLENLARVLYSKWVPSICNYTVDHESNDAANCHGGDRAGFYQCTSAHGWLRRSRRCRDDCAHVGAVGPTSHSALDRI
jgi:hypothetical protein